MTYRSLRNYPLSMNIVILTIIAVLYFLSALVGMLIKVPSTNITPLWPPAGVALAAILLFGYRPIISIFIGSFFLNIYEVMQVWPDSTLAQYFNISFLTGIGASLQAAANAALIKQFVSKKLLFTNTFSIIKFYIIGAISCLINANIGVFALIINGLTPLSNYFTLFSTWWIGDTSGLFIIAPLLLVWAQLSVPRFLLPQLLEAMSMVLLVFVTAWLIDVTNPSLSFLFLAYLIWAGIRFGLHGATAMMFLVSILIVIITTRHEGLFANESLDEALRYIALFISVVSCINLILAAEYAEHHTAYHQFGKIPSSLKQTIRYKFKSIRKWLKR